MSKQWIVKIREANKNPRIPNKKPYTFLRFDCELDVKAFLPTLVNYAMPPLDIKVYQQKKRKKA